MNVQYKQEYIQGLKKGMQLSPSADICSWINQRFLTDDVNTIFDKIISISSNFSCYCDKNYYKDDCYYYNLIGRASAINRDTVIKYYNGDIKHFNKSDTEKLYKGLCVLLNMPENIKLDATDIVATYGNY